MPFQNSNGLRYFTFGSFDGAGIVHAVFTRQGGVSPAPWSTLNLGGTVGDEPHRVAENRKRAFDALDLPLDSLYDVWQVHGNQVVCTEAPRPLHIPHLKADAILTDRPGVTLMMRFADCVPVLVFAPKRRVIGLIHAGWLGTVNRIAAAAVSQLKAVYGVASDDLIAAIGPSIGPDHYEVGPEVIRQVENTFQDAAGYLLMPSQHRPGHAYLDLWAANRLVIEQAGVQAIETAGICTACHPEDWYSHRGEVGQTGRFGALIALDG